MIKLRHNIFTGRVRIMADDYTHLMRAVEKLEAVGYETIKPMYSTLFYACNVKMAKPKGALEMRLENETWSRW